MHSKHACGVCPERALIPTGGTLPMLGCPSCQGKLLMRSQAQQLVVNELGVPPAEVSAALATPGPRRLRCASCGGTMAQVRLRGVDVDLCGQCGAMWFERGLIELLTKGKRAEPPVRDPHATPHSGPPSSSAGAAPRPKPTALGTVAPPPSRAPVVVAAAALGALVIGAGVWFWAGREKPEKKVDPSKLSDLAFYDRYAGYFSHHTFGGRSCDWWAERLAALAPGGSAANAELFTLARKRAKAAGLKVTDLGGGQWDVKPNAETVAALVERTGAK